MKLSHKRICSYFSLVLLLLLFLLPTVTFAHSGRTDANGGHTDRSTGEYHYHHGYAAHQHTGGVCPYDYKDATSSNTTKKKSSSSATYGPARQKTTATTSPANKPKASENVSLLPVSALFVGSIIIICFVFRKKGKPSAKKIERKTEEAIQNKIHDLRKRPQYENLSLFAEFSKDICSDRLLSAAYQNMSIKNIAVSAEITSESKNTYITTLTSCTCEDFRRRKKPCKHMYRLALEIGLLANTPMSDYIEILNAIKEEKDALKKLQSKAKK